MPVHPAPDTHLLRPPVFNKNLLNAGTPVPLVELQVLNFLLGRLADQIYASIGTDKDQQAERLKSIHNLRKFAFNRFMDHKWE